MRKLFSKITQIILSVPVRIKVLGIVIIPVLILGLSLNYWVTTGLSDWLSYLIPDDRVVVAMQAGGRSVLLVSILAALAAILFSMLLMYMLTQPLVELSKTANQVAEGDLASRADIWSRDEIGEVATSFNEMVDHLVKSQEDLKLSNRQLSLMNEIAIASTLDQEIHDTLFIMLNSVLKAVKLQTGWIYLYDEERNKFHLATWQGVPDNFKPDILICEEGNLCTCQKDMLAGKLHPKPKIMPCDRIEGFKGNHITLTLQTGERPMGFLNIMVQSPNPLPEEDIDLLSISSAQIGEFVAKAWFQLKLNEKEAARQKLMKALIKAQEDERSRLASELHDGAGQMLTSLLVRLKAVERTSEDKTTSENLNQLCENVSDVIEFIRLISYQNRPVVLEEFGLSQAIENLAEEMIPPAGLDYDLEVDIKKIHLPKEIETTIYRIVQEALTNVIRHANANHVEIRLWAEKVNLNVVVKDDGSGFDVDNVVNNGQERHLGLTTIKDRLELLGGNFYITSSDKGGTSLHAVLPLLEESIYAE